MAVRDPTRGFSVQGVGNDVFDGGPGTDRVDHGRYDRFDDGPGPVFINLTTGQLQGVDQGNDTLLAVENASGTLYRDTLIGNADPNDLYGGPGCVTFFCVNADDHLEGLDGDDRLTVSSLISGVVGFIDGGNGTDTCLGGAATVLNCEVTAAADGDSR